MTKMSKLLVAAWYSLLDRCGPFSRKHLTLSDGSSRMLSIAAYYYGMFMTILSYHLCSSEQHIMGGSQMQQQGTSHAVDAAPSLYCCHCIIQFIVHGLLPLIVDKMLQPEVVRFDLCPLLITLSSRRLLHAELDLFQRCDNYCDGRSVSLPHE